MSFFSIFENFFDSFFKSAAPTETKIVDDMQLALPMLAGVVGTVEGIVGLDAKTKAAIQSVLANAQAIVGGLSSVSAPHDIDSAFAALSAVSAALPTDVQPEAQIVLAVSMAAYSAWKNSQPITVTAPAAA